MWVGEQVGRWVGEQVGSWAVGQVRSGDQVFSILPVFSHINVSYSKTSGEEGGLKCHWYSSFGGDFDDLTYLNSWCTFHCRVVEKLQDMFGAP